MISLLLEIMSACARFMLDLLSFACHAGMSLLSAIASILVWPAKAVFQFFHGSWTPLFWMASGVLAVLVLGLMALALLSNYRRKTK